MTYKNLLSRNVLFYLHPTQASWLCAAEQEVCSWLSWHGPPLTDHSGDDEIEKVQMGNQSKKELLSNFG